jgi:hypothetical protein
MIIMSSARSCLLACRHFPHVIQLLAKTWQRSNAGYRVLLHKWSPTYLFLSDFVSQGPRLNSQVRHENDFKPGSVD